MFTQRKRRLAAAGMRTWADVTHRDGARWMTWQEVMARYPTLRSEEDRVAYTYVTAELEEGRWDTVRQRWWQVARTQAWREWAAVRETTSGNPKYQWTNNHGH